MIEFDADGSEFMAMMRELEASRPSDPVYRGWLEDDLVLITEEDKSLERELVGLYGLRVGHAMWLDHLDGKPQHVPKP